MTGNWPKDSPPPDGERALLREQRMKTFEFRANAAFIVTLALAGVTLVFCCLAVIAALEQRCAGHEWRDGYRPYDFIALFFVSAVIVAMVAGMALGMREWRGGGFVVNGVWVAVVVVWGKGLGSGVGLVVSGT